MSVIGIDYRTQYEAAEERIRELEEKAGHQHSQIYILDERIAKAREILEEHRNAHAVGWKYGKALSDWCEKRDAWLNALEGK